MERHDLVLAALSPAKNGLYTPVMVQKLFFLIDRVIPKLVGGPYYNFVPYNYGPFDAEVYNDLENLAHQGHVQIILEEKWRNYALTESGLQRGEKSFGLFDPKAQEFIIAASETVRRLSFTELVSAIYKKYPDMQKNSVFQG
jgi:uncharacterized protein YwgA